MIYIFPLADPDTYESFEFDQMMRSSSKEIQVFIRYMINGVNLQTHLQRQMDQMLNMIDVNIRNATNGFLEFEQLGGLLELNDTLNYHDGLIGVKQNVREMRQTLNEMSLSTISTCKSFNTLLGKWDETNPRFAEVNFLQVTQLGNRSLHALAIAKKSYYDARSHLDEIPPLLTTIKDALKGFFEGAVQEYIEMVDKIKQGLVGEKAVLTGYGTHHKGMMSDLPWYCYIGPTSLIGCLIEKHVNDNIHLLNKQGTNFNKASSPLSSLPHLHPPPQMYAKPRIVDADTAVAKLKRNLDALRERVDKLLELLDGFNPEMLGPKFGLEQVENYISQWYAQADDVGKIVKHLSVQQMTHLRKYRALMRHKIQTLEMVASVDINGLSPILA